MKKILILEDNIKSATIIENALYKINDRIEIFSVTNVQMAYPVIMNNRIDVLIVDIILDTSKPGDTSGIKFVEKIRNISQYKFTPVIFVTSLEDPEIFAYRELHCYGYIEKPFDIEQIKKLVIEALEYEAPVTEERILYLRKDGILFPVNCQEIVYVRSINHKMCFYFFNKTELTIYYKTCKQIMEEADVDYLLQCNKGTIVNRKYIVNADISNNIVTMKGNVRISIGSAYKKNFFEALK